MKGIGVGTLQDAVSALQDRVNKYKNEGFVESWSLTLLHVRRRDNNNNNNNNNPNSNVWWNRFLTILSQEGRQTQLEEIQFSWAFLNRPNDEVLERFFGDVLPNLASLRFFRFQYGQILPLYINKFLTALVNHSNNDNMVNLQGLYFDQPKLHPSTVAAIARLLSCAKNENRNGPTIENISLQHCFIDSTGCELMFKALEGGNTCLRKLQLSGNDISEISLEAAKALGNCKRLSYLNLLGNPLSDQSLCHLAEGLRTNRSLVSLAVEWGNARLALDEFAELLKSFNYSLCDLGPGIRRFPLMEGLLRQNDKIRRLAPFILEDEQERIATSNYCLSQLVYLWPLTMECIGSKPSLIYHFLRHVNLESFMNQLLPMDSCNTKNGWSWVCCRKCCWHCFSSSSSSSSC